MSESSSCVDTEPDELVATSSSSELSVEPVEMVLEASLPSPTEKEPVADTPHWESENWSLSPDSVLLNGDASSTTTVPFVVEFTLLTSTDSDELSPLLSPADTFREMDE